MGGFSLGTFSDPALGGGATPIVSQPASVSGSTGDSSFLSGLGGLFSSIGSSVAAGIKASQPSPTPYVPYYTATGVNQSVAPMGIFSLFQSPVVLLLIGLGIYFLAKKKE